MRPGRKRGFVTLGGVPVKPWTLQRYSVHTPGLIEGFLGRRGGEKKVCEGGDDRRRSSTSLPVGLKCCERYHTRHRCAHGGPFPSIIHLSRSPIGARVISLPPRPPVPLISRGR